MKRFLGSLWGLMVALTPSVALAEGVSGYSRGNAFIYFSVIAFVLIFGIHDVFRKKWLTWTAVIVIPTLLYLNLPVK